jgi:hypothetical protein
MTQGTQADLLLDDDIASLQPYLERRLADYFGHGRSILSIDRRPCPYTSSFRIDEIGLKFHDGSRMQLVMKHLSAMVEEARRARPAFLCEPRREINAYRWILPHAPAGTAAWYGEVQQSPTDRCCLLLEQVNGLQLWQVGDVSIWEQTAAWIARFHRAFSPLRAQQLATRSGALRYDEGFYRRWLDRARRFADGNVETRQVLDGVARRYDAVVRRLTRQPQTLIHGEFYASNVIVEEHSGVRICPVDWEMTALGPALMDLAALTAGWVEATQRTLARAYLAAARNGNGNGVAARRPVRLPRDFMTDLDCCRLHLAVRMLGWSDDWEPPRDHAHNWLAEAERITSRLQLR